MQTGKEDKNMKNQSFNENTSPKIHNLKQRILKNIILAIACAVFATIYECFSHQVYSPFMICAFLFPVILGIIPDTIRLIRTYKKPLCHTRFSSIACTIQQCGIYTLTVGSILRGILDIYGTTNSTSIIYWWIGGLLLIVGFIIELRP